MMTNEEIALLIKNGHDELIALLWEKNIGFIKWSAQRVMTALGSSPCVEIEDLVQSAYFALVAAVADYKPGEWKFTTYLRKHLQTAFAEATGYRTVKGRRDPARRAISLETPLGEDPDSGILEEVIPDPKAEALCTAVDDQIYRAQLESAFAQLLPELPEDQRETLFSLYWEKDTYAQAAEKLGRTPAEIRTAEQKAIRYFRRPNVRAYLRPFCEYDFYSGSLGSFRRTGMSVQERYVLMEEQRREWAYQQQKAEERVKQALAEADRILARYRHTPRAV